MKCFCCGEWLPEDSKFCTRCGQAQGVSRELVERAKNGDQEAVSQLYNTTYNQVYAAVKTMIKEEDAALDIVQDSYVKAFQSLSQLQEPEKFRAWVKRIARNRAIDSLRKASPVLFSSMSEEEGGMVEFEDDRVENLPEVVVDRQETARLIGEILDSLSEEQRVAVSLFYYEQMSVREIAQLLGVSENTVKSRLSYGRKKIEAQVRDLEKRGTKLYSLAPLPFLLLLFRNLDAQAAQMAPNAAVLQNVQQSLSASGAGEAGGAPSTAAKAETTAAKAGGTAAKGLAGKIIAGVVAVAVLGGGAAGIFALNQKSDPPAPEPSQTVQEEADSPETESQLPQEESPEQEPGNTLQAMEIYQPILTEYGQAMGKDSLETADFPHINYLKMVDYYASNGRETNLVGFFSAFYDIDGNGVDELLIGYGSAKKEIVDLYTIQNGQPQKLLDSLGTISELFIYPDGSMVVRQQTGEESVQIERYRLDQDGTLNGPEVLLDAGTPVSSLGKSEEAFLQEKMNGQERVQDFDWMPIDPIGEETASDTPVGEESSSNDLTEWVGAYINGQDWNAGTITIEENDGESVKVRLEAFRQRQDQELSTIFEAVAVPAEDGLTAEVSGKEVKLVKGNMGFYLEADPALQQEWGLDPYIYQAEYVSLGPAS